MAGGDIEPFGNVAPLLQITEAGLARHTVINDEKITALGFLIHRACSRGAADHTAELRLVVASLGLGIDMTLVPFAAMNYYRSIGRRLTTGILRQ